jgi:TolB-like protein
MICSGSSSSRRRLASALALSLGAAAAACGHAAPAARPTWSQARLAVFPVQNAAGGAVPVRALSDLLEVALAQRGVEVLSRLELDRTLADHRIRFTGGVDRKLAKVLRDDLGVDAVLIPTVDQYTGEAPPKLSLAVRLVTTGERPVVVWADGVARAGNDSPGLLARGLLGRSADVERAVVAEVARRVEAYVSRSSGGDYCGGPAGFKPRRVFRATVLDDVGRRSIAVLPFTNASGRRGAAEVVTAQFVAQLARTGSFEVLDPGLIREQLLAHRVVLAGGVSVDQALALLDLLEADLVLSGYVEVYDAPAGSGPPTVEFTAYVIDRRTAELVWSSTSHGAGDDGVFFFGAGRVYSSAALSCRMALGVVDAIVGHRQALSPSG